MAAKAKEKQENTDCLLLFYRAFTFRGGLDAVVKVLQMREFASQAVMPTSPKSNPMPAPAATATGLAPIPLDGKQQTQIDGKQQTQTDAKTDAKTGGKPDSKDAKAEDKKKEGAAADADTKGSAQKRDSEGAVPTLARGPSKGVRTCLCVCVCVSVLMLVCIP